MRKIFYHIVVLVLLIGTLGVAKAALSGAYTIGAGAASATNYSTFAAAVADMSTGIRPDGGPVNGPAVSGPVTFTISAGTYNERISIPAITGASAINTITFNGVDPLTRIITFNSVTANDYTILLNGADYIRLQNLGIQNTGPTYGYSVQLLLSADNNIISGCRLLQPTTSTSTTKAGIMAGTTYTVNGLFASNLTVQNNTFIGGYINCVVNGPTTQATGLNILNNTMTDAYFSGMYIQYMNLAVINENVITMRTGNASNYGAQLRYCSQFDFNRNKISNAGVYGLYIFNANFNGSNPANVTNNMIGGVFQTTGTAYGIYMTTNRFVNLYHNSVLIDNPTISGARGMYVLGTTVGLDVRNNAFATTNTGVNAFAIYVTTASTLAACDYNAYFTAGTNVAHFQANYTTLPAMQAAFPAYNQNCQRIWPNYLSNTDLHTFGPPLANWAVNIPAITSDFDNQSRPLAPDLIKDVGADEFLLPPVDADVWSIVNPTVPIVGANPVQVQLQNNGSNSLNGVPITMQYSTDGGATWPVSQTFTPTTLAGSGSQETFTFTTPWVITVANTYNLCARISPILVGDPDATDQLCLSVCTGMSGVYTVNNGLPTGGSNYNSFTDLATALNGCGVAAPVTVNVVPGLYVETFNIGLINGVSAINTVTIDGGDTSLVTIAYNHTTINASVITLDNADYVTFKNLKVNSAGTTYGSCFKFTNTADHNTIDHCVMTMPNTQTSAYHIGILASGSTYTTYGDHANFLTVSDCKIRGGYYGVRINGISTTAFSEGNRILNTKISEFYYYGIYSYYQNYPEFIGNAITSRTSGVVTTSGYGIYSYYAQGNFRFERNTIHSVGTYGIYCYYGNANNSGRGRIANNMVGGNFATTGSGYGLYMFNNRDIDVYHNSISLGGNSGYAVYVAGSTLNSDSLRFVNNIFSSGSSIPGIGGRAFFVASPGVIQAMNHNLYYSLGAQAISWGGTIYNSLASFQSGAPAFNANSVWDDPGFVGATNLHLVCSPIDNLGTPVGITSDIDQQARSLTTPDVGADEFTSITVSIDLGSDFSACGGTTIYADTVHFDLFTWGGGQYLDFLNIDSTGQYTIFAIDSNNCRARDTIVVTVDSLPLLPYNNDTLSACDNATLDAQNAGSSYVWSNGPTTQAQNPGAAGVYYVTITTTAGCALTDTVSLLLFANPNLELGNDTTFCLGTGSVINAGSGPTGTSYQWNTGAVSQVIVVSAPGTYTVTVTSPLGCESTDSVNLNLLMSPVVNLGPNHTECGPFTLDAQNPGLAVQWSTGATTQTISATTSGTYAVTVTNALGCASSDVIAITVATPPTVALGPDQVLCAGQTVTLNAGNTGMQHQWSNGAVTPSITVSTAGTYIVNVTNLSTGCVGSDTIQIDQSFLSLDLGPNTVICADDTMTLDAGAAPDTYSWSTGQNTQTIQVTSPGIYMVTVSDAQGCVLVDQILVSQGNSPQVGFVANATSLPLFQPSQFTDMSINATSWFWDFGDGFTSTLQSPSHTFLAIGNFNVCLTAFNGVCPSTVCQTIAVGPPVEVEDALFAHAINLYPNPSQGHFSLDFDLTKSVDLGIDVLSMAGQQLLHRNLKAVRMHNESFDLQDIAAGMYFLRVTSSKGDVWLRKLIIE